MAAITVTAANVIPVAGYSFYDGIAGATITAGQSVYKDTSDSDKIKLADADAAASSVALGISLTGASAGQPVRVQTGGQINPGGTAVVGQVYVVGLTAGDISTYGDLGSGDYVSILGVATTASNILMGILNSNTAKP